MSGGEGNDPLLTFYGVTVYFDDLYGRCGCLGGGSILSSVEFICGRRRGSE